MLLTSPMLLFLSSSPAARGLKVFINYTQTMAIVRYFPLGWSAEVKSVFDYMAVFNLDWFILAPECLLGFAYAHRMWMVTLGVCFAGGPLWAYYSINKLMYGQDNEALSPTFGSEVRQSNPNPNLSPNAGSCGHASSFFCFQYGGHGDGGLPHDAPLQRPQP